MLALDCMHGMNCVENRGVGMDLWIESPDKLGTKQFAVPETATADVTLRRVRGAPPVRGNRESGFASCYVC